MTETLYRGLADNFVGRVIDNLLRLDFVVVAEIGCDSRRSTPLAVSSSSPPTSGSAWDYVLPASTSAGVGHLSI